MINVIVSGFFNPIHTYHIRYIDNAYFHGKRLAWPWEKVKLHILVNNGLQVKEKGSCPFLSDFDRQLILEKMYPIANVMTTFYSSPLELGVSTEIKYIFRTHKARKTIFCNGGDRTIKTANINEIEVCNELGIKMLFGVGGYGKGNSSSELIKKAVEWHQQKVEKEIAQGI